MEVEFSKEDFILPEIKYECEYIVNGISHVKEFHNFSKTFHIYFITNL